jgi:hypothetical protein
MTYDFWQELREGEIHVRDNFQFELKSEFPIDPLLEKIAYKQEVFIFIPNSLQINSQTYSKQQFYLDQTNIIRYRTPWIPLSKLIDPEYKPSPLNRIALLLSTPIKEFLLTNAADEIKLFGCINREAIHQEVYKIVKEIKRSSTEERGKDFVAMTEKLCGLIGLVTARFRQLYHKAKGRYNDQQLNRYFRYVDEFTSLTIDEYLTILLKDLRSEESSHNKDGDMLISQLILQEKSYRKKNQLGPKSFKGSSLLANESILYRYGLLNRFILESLTLKSHRVSIEEKYSNVFGAMAAGIAMLIYMILFVWKSQGFVFNSFPFVFLAVVLYILKDRIKEGLKKFYFRQAYRWFPDYSTQVINPKGVKIGRINESFAFIKSQQLPEGFLSIRNRHFHEELQALHRHESIIQYKREVTLRNIQKGSLDRRRELTTIFRLNTRHFLDKASNAFQNCFTLDSNTNEIQEKLLPKVYHLNIIIRNTYLQKNIKPTSEIQTFRVVIDKTGIKRIEHIRTQQEPC